MKVGEQAKMKKLSRRVWTISQRGGNVMKFEVSLDNHRKLQEAVETVRGLIMAVPDVRVFQHDE